MGCGAIAMKSSSSAAAATAAAAAASSRRLHAPLLLLSVFIVVCRYATTVAAQCAGGINPGDGQVWTDDANIQKSTMWPQSTGVSVQHTHTCQSSQTYTAEHGWQMYTFNGVNPEMVSSVVRVCQPSTAYLRIGVFRFCSNTNSSAALNVAYDGNFTVSYSHDFGSTWTELYVHDHGQGTTVPQISLVGVTADAEVQFRLRREGGFNDGIFVDSIVLAGVRAQESVTLDKAVKGVMWLRPGDSEFSPVYDMQEVVNSGDQLHIDGDFPSGTLFDSVKFIGFRQLQTSGCVRSNGRVSCNVLSTNPATMYGCRSEVVVVISGSQYTSAAWLGWQMAPGNGEFGRALVSESTYEPFEVTASYTGDMPTGGSPGQNSLVINGDLTWGTTGLRVQQRGGLMSSSPHCVTPSNLGGGLLLQCEVPPGVGRNVTFQLFCPLVNQYNGATPPAVQSPDTRFLIGSTLSYAPPSNIQHVTSSGESSNNLFPYTYYDETTFDYQTYFQADNLFGGGSYFGDEYVASYRRGADVQERECSSEQPRIRCRSPKGAGASGWEVSLAVDGHYGPYEFVGSSGMGFPAPSITNYYTVAPMVTVGGSKIAVVGYNLGAPNYDPTGTYGSSQQYAFHLCMPESGSWTPNSITIHCFTSPGFGSWTQITMSTGGQSSPLSTFFGSYVNPQIDAIVFAGTLLQPDGSSAFNMTGSNFGPVSTPAVVTISQCSGCLSTQCTGCNCVSGAVDHTLLVCGFFPAGQGNNVGVYVSIGSVSSIQFTTAYIKPTITSVPHTIPSTSAYPSSLYSVPIQGTNFGVIGETTVSVRIEHPIAGMSVTVVYSGSPQVSCSYTSPGLILCSVSGMTGTGTYHVYVSSNNNEALPFSIGPISYAVPYIDSVDFPSAPTLQTQGCERVTIQGAHFGTLAGAIQSVTMTATSVIKEIAQYCYVISDSQIYCVAPPGAGSGWEWTVDVGGQDTICASICTTSYGSPVVQGSQVSSYSTDANSNVMVYGQNFGPTIANYYYCFITATGSGTTYFSGTLVDGTTTVVNFGPSGFPSRFEMQSCSSRGYNSVLSRMEMSCQLPEGYGTTFSATVAVTTNGVTVTSPPAAVQFSYYAPYVSNVVRNTGSSDGFAALGGDIMTIHGNNFGPVGAPLSVWYNYSSTVGRQPTGCARISDSAHYMIQCTTVAGVGSGWVWTVYVGGRASACGTCVTAYEVPTVTSISGVTQLDTLQGSQQFVVHGVGFGPPNFHNTVPQVMHYGRSGFHYVPVCVQTSASEFTCTAVSGVYSSLDLYPIYTIADRGPTMITSGGSVKYAASVITGVTPQLNLPVTGSGVTLTLSGDNFGPTTNTLVDDSTGAVSGSTVRMYVYYSGTVQFGPTTCTRDPSNTAGSTETVWCPVPADGFGKDLALRTYITSSYLTDGAVLHRNHSVSYAAPVVSELRPNIGPASGSTQIEVHGQNFGNIAVIQFLGHNISHNVTSFAFSYNERWRLNISTPQSNNGRAVPVLVRIGNQDANNTVPFQYYRFSHLTPAFSPEVGGVTLTMVGDNFVSTTLTQRVRYCNTSVVTCTNATATATTSGSSVVFVSSTRFTITVPALPHGTYTVDIMLNGQQYTRSPTNVVVYQAPVLVSLSPRSGPLPGGTVFDLHGSFTVTGALKVRIGDVHLSCTHLSAVLVRCVSNNVTSAGERLVSVSMDHNNPQYSNNSVYFQHYVQPNITRMDFPLGPTVGGALITVHGDNIVFTNDTVGVKLNTSVCTDAKYVSVGGVGAITCLTPARASAGFVYVQIALNDQQFTFYNYVWYQYYDHPTLNNDLARPAFGPIRGGYFMQVHAVAGAFLVPDARLIVAATYGVRVQFQYGPSYSRTSTVTAVRVNATHLNITVPTVTAGAGPTRVRVALNNVSFTPTWHTFTFYDPPYIASIKPVSGPVTGGTSVTLTGTFFDTGVFVVRFGATNMSCTYVSTTTATCLSLDYTAHASSLPFKAALSVTIDTSNLPSLVFRDDGVKYQFYGPFKLSAASSTEYVGGLAGVVVTLVVVNGTNTGELGVRFAGESSVTIAASPAYELAFNVLPASGDAGVTSYPMRITLDTRSYIQAGRMRRDCSDVRVRFANYSEAVSYYVEAETCNRADTGIWIVVPAVAAVARRRLLAAPDITFKVLFGEPLMTTDLGDAESVYTHYSSMDFEDTDTWVYPMEQTVDVDNAVTRFAAVVDSNNVIGAQATYTVARETGIEVGVMHPVPSYDDTNSSSSCTHPIVYFSPGEYQSLGNALMRVDANCTHMCISTTSAVNCTQVARTMPRYSVSMGTEHGCVFGPSGIDCWGANTDGQTTVAGGVKWSQVSAGGTHTCGIAATDGLIKCWGSVPVPAGVQSQTDFEYVRAGVGFTCAQRTNGSVTCWGATNPNNVVSGALTSTTFSRLYTSADGATACGVRPDKIMKCWGNTIPISVTQTDGSLATDLGIKSVGISSSHACTIRDSTRRLFCSTALSNEPGPLVGDWVVITSGLQFSCAINTAFELSCFGATTSGQATPPSGYKWVDVTAAGNSACGITTTGAVLCWGDNTNGQVTPPSWAGAKALWTYERIAILLHENNDTMVTSSLLAAGTRRLLLNTPAIGDVTQPLRPYLTSGQSSGYTYYRLFATRDFSSNEPATNTSMVSEESHVWEFLTPTLNSTATGSSWLLLSQNSQNFLPENTENITLVSGPLLTSVSPSVISTNSRANITLVGTNLRSGSTVLPLVKVGKYGKPSFVRATLESSAGGYDTVVFRAADYLFQGSASVAAGSYPVRFSYESGGQFGVVASSPVSVNQLKLATTGFCSIARLTFDDETVATTTMFDTLPAGTTVASTCGSQIAGANALVTTTSGNIITTRAYNLVYGGQLSFGFGCTSTGSLTQPLLAQFSNNDGLTWKTHTTISTLPSVYTTYTLSLPLEARSAKTRFRWVDGGSTGSWAIDNVDVRGVIEGNAAVLTTTASPLSGPLNGSTVVTITGTNLFNVTCTFDGDSSLVPSNVSSDGTVLTCLSPARLSAGTASLQVCGSASPPFEFVYYTQVAPTAINMAYATGDETFTLDGANIFDTGTNEEKVVYGPESCATVVPTPFECRVSTEVSVRVERDVMGRQPMATAGRKGFPLGGGAMTIARFVYPAAELATMGVVSGSATLHDRISFLKFYVRKVPTFTIDKLLLRVGNWDPTDSLRHFASDGKVLGYESFVKTVDLTFSAVTPAFWESVLVDNWWQVDVDAFDLYLSEEAGRDGLFVEFMTFTDQLNSTRTGADSSTVLAGAGSFGYRQVAPVHDTTYERAAHPGLVWYDTFGGGALAEGDVINEPKVVLATQSSAVDAEPHIRVFDVSVVPMLQVCVASVGCLSRTVLDVKAPSDGINALAMTDTDVWVALNGQQFVKVVGASLKAYSSTDDVANAVTDINPPGSSPLGQTVFYVSRAGDWEDQPQYTVKFTFLPTVDASDETAFVRYPVDLSTWGRTTGELAGFSAFIRCFRDAEDTGNLECMSPQSAPYPGGAMAMFELSLNGYSFFRPSTTWRFHFFPVPELTTITENFGPQAGGASVTIAGVNLWNPAQIDAVKNLYSASVFASLVQCYFLPVSGATFSTLVLGSITGTGNDPNSLHRSVGSFNAGGEVVCTTRAEDPSPAVTVSYNVFVSFTGGLFNPRFNYFGKGVDPLGFGTDGVGFTYEACPPGQFAPVYTTPCEDCAAGKISTVSGAVECTDCAVATYTDTPGGTVCTNCPGGSTTMNPRDSQALIDPEDPDTFKTAPSVQDLLRTGAASAAECVCDVNYLFDKATSDSLGCSFGTCCVNCANTLVGAVCPGGIELNGSYSQPWASPGFFMLGSRNVGFKFYKCSPTEACFGGPSKFCATGYTGIFCGKCDKNYYRDGNRCFKCPAVDFVILGLMIVFLIVFIKLFAMLAPYLRGMGAPRIFFNYVAATASFIFFNLRWPTIVIEFYDLLKYLTLNIDLVRPECQLPIGFRMQFLIVQVTPLVITAILFAFYGVECIRNSYMCMPVKTWWVHFRERSGEVRHWWHPLWIFEHFIYRPTVFLALCFSILLLVIVLAAIRWVFQQYVNFYDRVVAKVRARLEKDTSLQSDVPANQTQNNADPLVVALAEGGEVLDRSDSSMMSVSSFASFRSAHVRGELFKKASDVDHKKQQQKNKKGKKKGKKGEGTHSRTKGVDEDSGPLPRFDLHDLSDSTEFVAVQMRFSESAIVNEYENRTFNNSTRRSSVLTQVDAPPEKLNWHDLVSRSWLFHDNVKTRFLQQSMRQEGLRDFEVMRNLQMQVMSKYPTHRDFKRTQDNYATVRLEAEQSEEVTEAMELKKKRTDALNTTLNALCMVLTFSHLILLRRALDMLACFEVVGGEKRLAAFPDVICWEGDHWELIAYAALALIVWGVGMPLLLFVLLYQKSVVEHSLDEHNNKARYGYLFLKYGRANWYWEFVIIMRKSLLVVILVFYQDEEDRFLQVLLALLLFLVSLALQRIYNPFIEEDLNGYEFLALSNNVIVLFVGSIFLTERIPFGGGNATGMGWFLIVFIAVVVAILFRATWEEVMQAIPGLHDLLTAQWVKTEFKRMSIQLIYGDRYVYDIAPAVAIRTSQYSDKEWARMNTFERNHIELALQRQEQLEQVPILTPVGQWCTIQWLKDVNTPPRDRDTYIEGIARNAAGVFTELFMIADRHLHNRNPRRPMELIAVLNEKRERMLAYFNQADEFVEDAYCVPLIHQPAAAGAAAAANSFCSVNGYLTFSEWQVNMESQVIDRRDYLLPDATYDIEDLYEEFGDWHMCETPPTLATAVDTFGDRLFAIGCTNGDVVVGVKASGRTVRLQPHYVPDMWAGIDDTPVMKMQARTEEKLSITCLKLVAILEEVYLVTTSADGTLALTLVCEDDLDGCSTIFHSLVTKNQVFSAHEASITSMAVGGNTIKMKAATVGGGGGGGVGVGVGVGGDDEDNVTAGGGTTVVMEPGAPLQDIKDDEKTPGAAPMAVASGSGVGVDSMMRHSTVSKIKPPSGDASVLPRLPVVATTGALDGSVVVWNLTALVMTHRRLIKPLPLNLLITAVSATGAPSRSRVRTPLRHRGAVRGVKIFESHLPPLAVSYGADGSLRVWDLGSLNVKLRYSELDTNETGMVTNVLRFSIKLESAINDIAIALLGSTIIIICGCENGRLFRFPLTVSGGFPRPMFVAPPAAIKKNPRWAPTAENHDDDVDQNRVHQLLLSDDHTMLFAVFDRYVQTWHVDPEKMVRKGTREYTKEVDRVEKAGAGDKVGGMQPIPSQGAMQPIPSGILPRGGGVGGGLHQQVPSGVWDAEAVAAAAAAGDEKKGDDDDDDNDAAKKMLDNGAGRRVVMVNDDGNKHGYTLAMATNRGHIQVWQVSAGGAFMHMSPQLRTVSERVRLAPNVSNENETEDPDLGDQAAIVSLDDAFDDDMNASDEDGEDYEDWMAPPPMVDDGQEDVPGYVPPADPNLPALPMADEMDDNVGGGDGGEISVIEYVKKPWYQQRYVHPYFLAPKFFTRWVPLFNNMLKVGVSWPERTLLKMQAARAANRSGGTSTRRREHLLRVNAKFLRMINQWNDMDRATRSALRRTASLDAARMAIRTVKSLKLLSPAEENQVIEMVKEQPTLATVINDYRRNNELDRIERLLEGLTTDSASDEMQKLLDINSEALFVGNVIRRRNKRFEWLILSLMGLPSMARDILASSTVRELASGDDWAIQPHEFEQLGVVRGGGDGHARRHSHLERGQSDLQQKLLHQSSLVSGNLVEANSVPDYESDDGDDVKREEY